MFETESKRNLYRQGTKVLNDIVNAFERGVLDDPEQSVLFCGLLACICEGKVEGLVDHESGLVKWSLTKEYSEEINRIKEALLDSELSSGKVIKGPWS